MLDNESYPGTFDIESTTPAGFWIRVAAYSIDFLVLLILVVASMFVKSVPAYIAVLVPMIVYKPILEGTLGGTAGKLALGLKVINPEGEKIGIIGGFVRAAVFLLPVIPGAMLKIKMIQQQVPAFDPVAIKTFNEANELLNYANLGLALLGVISAVVVAFTARKRGLHDMLADTYVIRTQKG